MKTIFLSALLLATAATSFVFGDEKTAVWERIYRNAVSDEKRYAVLQNIRELHDPQLGGLLTEALGDLLSRQIEMGDNNQIEAKVRLTSALVQELGDLKVSEAADQVYQVYKEVTKFPFLRAEAVMALGKMRATDFVPQLARDLSDLNLPPDRDKAINQEIVAFGLVQSLATMKDARGFEPVFFASIGWYSPQRKVKETARGLLKFIAEDPTEALLKILQAQPTAEFKAAALRAEIDSSAPDSGKGKVALAALEAGVRTIPANIVEATQWGELRKEALKLLVAVKVKSAEAPALYRQQYKTAGISHENGEVLSVIQALGANGTPECLSFLIELMSGFNVRASTPGLLTDFDIQQVRTILQAFKAAASSAARPVLLEGQYLYTPALQRDIKSVLTGLPQ